MATPHVTTVLILESGNVLASRVVEILSDWHASGWVTDVVVASTEEVISRGADIGNVILTRPASPAAGPERVRMKDLPDELQTRLVVIDPMGADADWVDRRGVLLRASSAISQAVHSRVAAIDVIIPWHGGAGYPGRRTAGTVGTRLSPHRRSRSAWTRRGSRFSAILPTPLK